MIPSSIAAGHPIERCGATGLHARIALDPWPGMRYRAAAVDAAPNHEMLVSATPPRLWLSLLLAVLFALSACTPVGKGAEWPPRARKWFDRADVGYRTLDLDDAAESVAQALRMQPQRKEVRILAAKISLAQLDYGRTVKLLEGVGSSEARGLRGRAYWYDGKLERAADELEALVADPAVRDPWARDVAKLARLGTGRQPFSISGGLLAVTEMPRLKTSALVVPLELNGEPALAMIATSSSEVVVDAPTAREPKWVSLGFDRRITVKDVPAISQDLSGISKELGAPIKVLLGGNVLRHLNATFDFGGSQFVVRSFAPPAPPHATNVRLHYVRGGGMAIRAEVGDSSTPAELAFMVDTSVSYAAVLDDAGWKKVGVDASGLTPLAGVGGNVSHGVLRSFRLGTRQISDVPGIAGFPSRIQTFEEHSGVDLDGIVGSSLLAAYRVTLVDGGRTMWLEDHQDIADAMLGPPAGPSPEEHEGEEAPDPSGG